MRKHCFFWLLTIFLVWPSESIGSEVQHNDGYKCKMKTLRFPRPPHPGAIGTRVDPSIQTYVQWVTLAEKNYVRRSALEYSEVTGTIKGVGWGGDNEFAWLESPYTYRLSYVLRIPHKWDGTLVVFHHGKFGVTSLKALETNLGPRSVGRVFHLYGDRFVSDAALQRGWAFFTVNYTPTDAEGRLYSTYLHPGTDDDKDGLVDEDPTQDDDGDGLGDEDPIDNFDNDLDGLVDEDPPIDDDKDGLMNEDPGHAPVDTTWDVPIARDMARVAKRLLKVLRHRKPTLTLGTGHSAGAYANFMLNVGHDPNRISRRLILVGDNYVRPYDPTSPKIFDGFIWFSGGGPVPIPVDPKRGISAPVVFFASEAEYLGLLSVLQMNELIVQGVDVDSLSRIYMVRNVTHQYADLWKAFLPDAAFGMADLFGLPRGFVSGGGEQVKPVTAALLDALRAWTAEGTPPPTSVLNGVPLDSKGVVFPQSDGGSSLVFPFVDHPKFDTYTQNTWPDPAKTGDDPVWLAAFTNVQTSLGARVDSVFLPETACRRGAFVLLDSPGGTWFVPFDEPTFLGLWGSSAAQQLCRVGAVSDRIAEGLYDPTVVPVDILPDQFPNTIDLSSPEKLPVAILSTSGFDATQVNPWTVKLAGASLQGFTGHHYRYHCRAGGRAREEDVNGDGLLDLVVHFRVKTLRFHPSDVIADLWGKTRDGTPFGGTDVVEVVTK